MSTWWNDYPNSVLQGQSFVPDVLNSNAAGPGVDMRGAEVGLHAIMVIDNVSGSSPTLDMRLQESDDDGVSDPYTDIVDFITGGIVAFDQVLAPADEIQTLNFKRSKRFVRANPTLGGASPQYNVGVSIHGMRKAVQRIEPAS